MNRQAIEPAATHRRPSNLFYVTRLRRPLIDRAEGIYVWDVDGRRYIDGCSGAINVNIGHGNRNVVEAMKRQMDRVSFAYRLHFENEPARNWRARWPPGCLPAWTGSSSYPAARKRSNPA